MLSQRARHLRAEGAYAVLARALALEAQGREIIHLEIGQPDLPTPVNVVRAGIGAIHAGQTRYGPPSGLPELRQALAEDAGRRRGVEIDPRQVVVAPGTKLLFLLPMLALLEPGDRVAYPDPGFPSYEAAIRLVGGVPVPVPLVEECGFDLDLCALEASLDGVRLLILNSPSNPTGGVHTADTLARLAELACRHDFWILSDEIYARLVYEGEAPSILSLPGMAGRAILVDGFSKIYSMAGWRLAYAVVPPGLAHTMDLLLTHTIGCTATFTQRAGLEAIRGPQEEMDAAVEEYRRRRDRMVAGLRAIPGIRCSLPRGAFYAFPNVQAFGRTSDELADLLLDEAGVAVLPGTAFGRNGEGYLRLSYATALDQIDRGLQRIESVLRSISGNRNSVTGIRRPPPIP